MGSKMAYFGRSFLMGDRPDRQAVVSLIFDLKVIAMARKPGRCPASDCTAAAPTQRALTDGELERIPEADRAALGRELGARICTYCSCVYNIDLNLRPHIRGWLGNKQFEEDWHPRL